MLYLPKWAQHPERHQATSSFVMCATNILNSRLFMNKLRYGFFFLVFFIFFFLLLLSFIYFCSNIIFKRWQVAHDSYKQHSLVGKNTVCIFRNICNKQNISVTIDKFRSICIFNTTFITCLFKATPGIRMQQFFFSFFIYDRNNTFFSYYYFNLWPFFFSNIYRYIYIYLYTFLYTCTFYLWRLYRIMSQSYKNWRVLFILVYLTLHTDYKLSYRVNDLCKNFLVLLSHGITN